VAVPSNHAYIRGGDEMVNLLLAEVAKVQSLVSSTAQEQSEEMTETVRSSAANDPRWAELAPDIDSWEDEDGNYAVGVPEHSPRHDQAMRLEYGDTTQAPVPLIRMGVLSNAVEMGWSMTQKFREAGY
jgi:hypothetical protein